MTESKINICPVCEKRFIATFLWTYKSIKNMKTTYYCSYHCFREAGGGKGKYKNQPKKEG